MGTFFIPIKNGIKAVLRTPVKTALFLILLTIATVFISIGVGLYSSARNMLKQADETFITAGEFTFTGGYYPDIKLRDPRLIEMQESFSVTDLRAVKGVVHAEENIRLRATVAGYSGARAAMPYQEESIFIAKIADLDTSYKKESLNGSYYSIIQEYIYAANARGAYHIYINLPQGEAFEYELDHYYLFTGYFREAHLAKSFYPRSYGEIFRFDKEFPYIIDITEYYPHNMDEFWATDAGKYYRRAADLMETVNSAVDIIATNNIEAVDSVHRGEISIIQGGYFTDEDYESGNKCIIPQGIATNMKLSIGDKITLNIHYPSNEGNIYDSYLPEEGFAALEEFEVAGVYQIENYVPYIYITDAGQGWLERSKSDYILGRVIVENSGRQEFEDYLEKQELLPAGVSLNIYDQGYEEAVIPILGMMETARLIIFVCSLFCFLLILFFGFFFVYRNGQTVTTLINLGTGYGKTLGFLLSGCALISVVSTGIGTTVGFLLSESVSQRVFEAAQATLNFDLRFSKTGTGIKSEVFAPVIELNLFVFAGFAGMLFLFTLIVCAGFSYEIIRKQNPTYKFKYKFKQKSKIDNKRISQKGLPQLLFVDCLPFSSLRYSVKSLIRGSSRSAVIPVIFLCITIFINVFFTVKSHFDGRLDTVYEDVPVTVQFADIRGRMIDNIITPREVIQDLLDSGYTGDYWYSRKMHYDYNGRILHADGTPDPTPLSETVIPPVGSDEYRHFMDSIDKNFNKIILTNNISRAPEFYYNKSPLTVSYAPGFSGDNLKEPAAGEDCITVVGFASTDFLEKHNLELGDTLALTMLDYTNWVSIGKLEFTIAGTYKANSTGEMIYMNAPLSMSSTSYSTGFLVKDSKNISEFKDWLALRYDEVNIVTEKRRWVIIDDMNLYRTIQSIERYINYINITYPLILLLILGTGFFTANTLMKGRLWEIAVMQGVGNSRLSIFSSFMIEQVFLSLPGIIGGLLISYFISGIIINTPNICIFVLCYYVGTGAAIIQAQSVRAIKSLKDKED